MTNTTTTSNPPTMPTITARFACKRCGAESPAGIGYAVTGAGPMPAPAADCSGTHAGELTTPDGLATVTTLTVDGVTFGLHTLPIGPGRHFVARGTYRGAYIAADWRGDTPDTVHGLIRRGGTQISAATCLTPAGQLRNLMSLADRVNELGAPDLYGR